MQDNGLNGGFKMQSKAYEFDEIADGPFSPIYPVIAQQIVEKTGIKSGICLDVGSGGGHLGLSLAEITDMDVILLDKLEDALNIANNRASNWGLSERTTVLLGDVQRMPLEDGAINLCISRGSVWFWEDQKSAFKEIYRVLADGGMAYIGGGFGTSDLKEQVDKKMKERDNEWPKRREKFVKGNTVGHFADILAKTGITNFEIIDDEKGIWVILRKESNMSRGDM
jgi:ubiquinone/menaquinone biosynthesis C-methylase UbiE